MKKLFSGFLVLSVTATLAFAGGSQSRRGGTINGLDPVTLSFIFFDSKKSATDEVWNAIAGEFRNELNVNFDVSFIAGSDYVDKMLVKFSAGDAWDLNYDGEWLQYLRVVAMNGYMTLNDLLPQYAPDLYRTYQDSGVLESTRTNGNIIALPWTIVMTRRPFFQWRADLLNVDPAQVKTIEAVEQVLYDLKQRYPDRYIIEGVDKNVFILKNDLIAIPRNFVYSVNDSSVRIQHIAETAAYRERGRYAEKWQNDGLIWADVLVDQLDHNQLINQGRLLTKWGIHESANEFRGWVEPAARWGSASLYDDKIYPLHTALGNIVAVPRTSKNPERTLMWLNLMETSQKMFDMVMYGIEGRTYVKDTTKPNTVRYPDGMNDNNSNYMNWAGRWALFKPHFMRGDAAYRENFWQDEKDFALNNPNTIAAPLEGFSLNSESIVNELAQIQAIYDAAEKMLDVGLAGASGAAIDRLVADLNRAGLQRVKAEYQRQVDVFLAARNRNF
jgi:putative aldouronate transport system substrate-binding protein